MSRLIAEDGSTRDPIERLAEEFLDRYRRGERPGLSEYEQAHPELAEKIRDFFPALVELEGLKQGGELGDPTGSFGDGRSSPRGRSPDRLGDYQILREIGRGGMGIVYEAVRESLKSRVALKVMNPRPNERDRERFALRFKSEARAAAGLHHTNIVGVFDYGEHGGHCYYAMQFIAGHGLDRILDDVRQLRLEEGRKDRGDASQVRESIGEQATIGGSGAWRIGASESALPGASTRRLTEGLLSGQFGRPLDATAPTGLVGGELPTDPPPVPPPSPPGGPVPSGSVDEPSLSSSSLAAKTEVRYFREVARLGAQVADALGHAHRRGVIHRDIKPSNLLLDALGNVWVTDFGLAKLEEGDDLSNSRDIVGTLRYMAPERFRGVSDRRCDTYALGASLYEMLTLRPAFEGSDQIQLIDRIVNEPPKPPRQLDRQIPRDLETIVLKSLAKNPADRFASAEEMAAELTRFVEQRPIKSRSVSPYERLWRWCKRNPGLAAANALAAALTVTLAIVATLSAYKFREQRNDLAAEQRKLSAEQRMTKASLERTERAERKARSALGRSLQSEGATLLRSGYAGQRFESLDWLKRSAQLLDDSGELKAGKALLRDHATLALTLPDIRSVRELSMPRVSRGGGFDPATGVAAVVDLEGTLLVPVDHEDQKFRLPGPVGLGGINHGWVAFSRDGAFVSVTYEMNQAPSRIIHVWDVRKRERIGELASPCLSARFDLEGRRLYYSAAEGDIAVWELASRRESARIPLGFRVNRLAFDPTGRRLAVSAEDEMNPRLAIVDVASCRVVASWDKEVGSGALAWSDDGRLLVSGGTNTDSRGHVWDMDRGARISTLEGHVLETIDAYFLPRSHRIFTQSWDSTTKLWDAVSGNLLLDVVGEAIYGLAADGRHLMGGRSGREWKELADGRECRVLRVGLLGNRIDDRNTSANPSAEFSADGRLLATADWQGARIWDAGTGTELARLDAGRCETVTFESGDSGLITSGAHGIFRWPIRLGGGSLEAIAIGPPELIREPPGGSEKKIAWLPGRKSLASIRNADAQVQLVDIARPRPFLGKALSFSSFQNHRMTNVSVSPDGRWMAAGGWREAGVILWDLEKRRFERIIASPEADTEQYVSYYASFSPDGRWLVTSALHGTSGREKYLFWKVGSWELGYRIETDMPTLGSVPFTADGRMMALRIAPDQILLADPNDGREIARLTTLRAAKPNPLAFSPDGTKLVVITSERATFQVWDLRAIRAGLARANLDWDWPPYPETKPTAPPGPIHVEGRALDVAKRRAAERQEYDRRLATDPDDAHSRVGRGWLASREGRYRDAIDDLEQTLRLRPDDIDAPWLLADAMERAGDVPGAIAALDRLVARTPDEVSLRFRRGMLELHLGLDEKALADFDHARAHEVASAPIAYRRTIALLRLDRASEALPEADRLVAEYPRDFAALDLRARARQAAGDLAGAEADRQEAGRLTSGSAASLNEEAWPLLTGPLASRDPDLALAMSRRSVELEGNNSLYLNTYGLALCRCRRFAEAVPILERSLAAAAGKTDGFDLLFLAIAHHHLGHPSLAGDCLKRALHWRAENHALPGRWKAEFDEFEAEARALLQPPASTLPAIVFAPE